MEKNTNNVSEKERKREFDQCWDLSQELSLELAQKLNKTGFNRSQVIITLGMVNGIILGDIFSQMEDAWVEQELPRFLIALEGDIRTRIGDFRAHPKIPHE